jgi:hypothetical protein
MVRTLVLVTFSSCLMFEFSEIFIISKFRILLDYEFFFFFLEFQEIIQYEILLHVLTCHL